MNLLGNIVWLLLGGLAVAVEYFVSGLALCLTIVGIPFGIQALKLGLLALRRSAKPRYGQIRERVVCIR